MSTLQLAQKPLLAKQVSFRLLKVRIFPGNTDLYFSYFLFKTSLDYFHTSEYCRANIQP